MQTYTTYEAEHQKSAQKRRSVLTALLVTIGIHVVLIGILIAWVVSVVRPSEPTLIIEAPPSQVEEDMQMKDFASLTRQTPSSSSQQMSKLITPEAVSDVAIPVVEDLLDETIELGTGFGDGVGSGLFGSGLGGGMGFPPGSPIRERCSQQDRKRRLAEGGGDATTEEAVMKGLRWLKSNQNEDGSWGSEHPPAMTGLAILAFLGHCETPDSPEFGETVTKGLVYLVDMAMGNGGVMRTSPDRHWSYEHGICTYALAEAYSIIKYGQRQIPNLQEAVMLAVPIVTAGQTPDGGWDYGYDASGDGDTSVTGWQMQALKAASLTGLNIPRVNASIRDGVGFLREMQGRDGAFAYREPGDDHDSLTGVGTFCLQMAGRGGTNDVSEGIEKIMDIGEWTFNENLGIYALYYNTMACFQEGGKAWTTWNGWFKDELVERQNNDGSWPAEGATYGAAGSGAAGADNVVYRVALCTLMLEVYYRYLPASK